MSDQVGTFRTRVRARISLAEMQLHKGELDAAHDTLQSVPTRSGPPSTPDLALIRVRLVWRDVMPRVG